MNSISLIGNITYDLELEYTSSNKEFCRFTLAVQRPFKAQNGEYETDFIKCTVWGSSAKYLTNYGYKGAKVGTVGRLQIDQYDKEGSKVTYASVQCNSVEVLSKRQSNEPTHGVDYPQKNEAQRRYDKIDVDELEETLPF